MTGKAFIRYAWRAFRVGGVLAAFVAAFIAYGIWKETPIKATAGGRDVGLDVISLQIDILALTLSAIGIGLAVMALFGYQALKEAAEARAERVGREVAGEKAAEVAERVARSVTLPTVLRELETRAAESAAQPERGLEDVRGTLEANGDGQRA